jgi:hypothetical protein
MIEMLTNLKNNKLQKAIGGGASGSGFQEAIDRLKKFLSGMSKKRRGKFIIHAHPIALPDVTGVHQLCLMNHSV